MRQIIYQTFIAGLICLWGTMHTFALGLDVELSRSQVSLGEAITVTLTLENGTGNEEVVEPELDFGQLRYMGPSSQISNVNGRITKLVGYIYQLVCHKPGDQVLPSFQVRTASGILKTNPVRIKVLSTEESRRMGDQVLADSDLQVVLSIDKPEVFVDEPVLARLKFYQRKGIKLNSQVQYDQPKFKDMVVKPLEKQNRYSENINGVAFEVIELNYLLLPGKSGSYTIDPVSFRTHVFLEDRSQSRGRNPRSSFFDDDPFDAFFGMRRSGRNVEVHRQSKPLDIKVLPLPGNKPAHFNGAVGNFEMSVALSDTQGHVGDALTLTIEIKGVGNLNSIQEPYLDLSGTFKSFESEVEVVPLDPELMIAGTKIFKKIVIPVESGTLKLPPVEFTYFNTLSRRYETLKSKEYVLNIKPGSHNGAGGSTSILSNKDTQPEHKLDLQVRDQGILFPAPREGLLTPHREIMPWKRVRQIHVWMPLLFVCGWLLFGFKRAALFTSTSRRAYKTWQRQLGSIKTMKNMKDAAESLSRGMYVYLSETFSVPAESLSPAEAARLIAERTAHQESATRWCEFLEQMDAIVFGFQAGGTPLESLATQADALVKQLDQQVKRK